MTAINNTISFYFQNKARFIGIIIVMFIFVGCEYDPIEPDFGYLFINSASVETNKDQGQNTSAITEAWVAINDEEIGTYQIPGIVPVPSGKDIKIVIFPGVRLNDRPLESIRYPMYKEINISKTVIANKIDTIDLIYQYKENIKLAFLEDFENGHGFFNILDTSQTSLNSINAISSSNNQHGNFIGSFNLTELKDHIFLGHKTLTDDLKRGASPVWMEIDSKSEHLFSFILRGEKPGQGETRDEIARTFKSDEWKKVYFNLTEVINNRRLDAYEIVIFSIFESTEENPSIEFQLDNIKILHL